MSRPADTVLGYVKSTKRSSDCFGRHRTFSRFLSTEQTQKRFGIKSDFFISDITENKAESDLLFVSVLPASLISNERLKTERAISLFSKFSECRGRQVCTRS